MSESVLDPPPSLIDALLRDPALSVNLTSAQAAALMAEVAGLQAALMARVVAGTANGPSAPKPVADRRAWLSADQVANRLSVTRRWVYSHAEQLGARRLSRKCLRIPQRGLDLWLAKEGG